MSVRVRKTFGRWTVFCRWCWWFHSYPTQPVALHAACQHLRYWIGKENVS